MSKIVERRGKVLSFRKMLNERKFDIAVESDVLERDAKIAAELEVSKQYYASCRIQGVVRGFMARYNFRILIEEYRAILVIQRVMRGKLGRMRWMREYWISISVVKSPEALAELLERSILHRETKGRGAAWQEYYDPLSDAFWYYERKTKLSTWKCPLQLQRDLICHWNGFQAFGGLPSDGKCRRVFDNVAEYQGHIKTFHKWYCVACDSRNFGATFPKCPTCGNSRSEDCDEGEGALKQAMEELQGKMSMFLAFEHKKIEHMGDKFVLKDHLVKLGMQKMEKVRAKKKAFDENKLHLHDDKKASGGSKDALRSPTPSNYDNSSVSDASSKSSRRKAKYLKKQREKEEEKKKKRLPSLAKRQSMEQAEKAKQWEVDDRTRRTKMLTVSGCLLPLAPLFTEEGEVNSEKLLYQTKEENQYAGLFRSVQEAADYKLDKELGGLAGEMERFRDPISRGELPGPLFENITKVKLSALDGDGSVPGVDDEGSSDDDELLEEEIRKDTKKDKQAADARSQDKSDHSVVSGEGSEGEGSHSSSLRIEQELLNAYTASKDDEGSRGLAKLLVCQSFLDGVCTKTTCPLAHPGNRDSAEILEARLPGRVRKVKYVICCSEWNGSPVTGCRAAGDCKKYHTYIRPSTREIILRIYPKRQGEKAKLLPSGAEITGNLHDNKLSGYGVMTWANGSTYVGDWEEDMRSGLGVYRTPFGTEYHGGWKAGRRHGLGSYHNTQGEEYVGEWKDGKMHGLGRLSSANGDVYVGFFQKHKYHGVGSYVKFNGDKFLGFCKDGMAQGLGLLAMGTGEKYKGNFDRNFRHGKGVCAYANGSHYAGNWYRGVPDGFGVFVGPQGERYVGQFSGGKKHGQGRYFFLDGSFYDGEFAKDLASGFGIYYFASGDKYAGEWKRNKRNGRGTYKYFNGSVYTGNWVDNHIDGKGKFDWHYGAHYRGEFKHSRKHGRGIFTWPNGNCYKGQFDYDAISGAGEMQYASGHRYVGHWAHNKKHGVGTFYYVNGAQYKGDWVEDTRHGKGRLTFMPNTFIEEYYDGDWVHDHKHGKGTYVFRKDEGTVYEGDWAMDRRTGKGKISYKDGSYYRGDFENEQMNGKGVYIGADASQYEGEWERNMRHGTGTLLDPNGGIYHGDFFNNMRHGKGKYQFSDGNIYEGEWQGNVIVGTGLSGKYTMFIGPTSRGGPEEVTVRCFPG